jgi:predicted cobalt transporter CbtA
MATKKTQRWIWLGGTVALLAVGIVIGLILENVWLGLLLAAIVSVVWLVAAESRKGDNAGVNDESHGIEV